MRRKSFEFMVATGAWCTIAVAAIAKSWPSFGFLAFGGGIHRSRSAGVMVILAYSFAISASMLRMGRSVSRMDCSHFCSSAARDLSHSSRLQIPRCISIMAPNGIAIAAEELCSQEITLGLGLLKLNSLKTLVSRTYICGSGFTTAVPCNPFGGQPRQVNACNSLTILSGRRCPIFTNSRVGA